MNLIDRISRNLDDATRAILDLAYAAPELTEPAFDRILSLLCHGHESTVRQIAEDLRTAEDFRSDYPRDVLARYGFPRALDPLTVCEAVAQDKEADAIRAAQLVASLIVRGVAA